VKEASRVQAAIEVLDRWLAGERLEIALTNWGRANRYAGSGDRLAVRDLCYTAARRRRSLAWVGGAESGRGLMLGLARLEGRESEWFTGLPHAPSPVSTGEEGRPLSGAPDPVRFDCPDWLWDAFGPDREAVLTRFQARAPVFLRVNLTKASPDSAAAALRAEGIETKPHPLAKTALEVTEGARKVAASEAYLGGLVELQDAASQAVIEMLEVTQGLEVLDYCAGGGGKALALAALGAKVTAHDANVARMKDLCPRAKRAATPVRILTGPPEGLWPVVVIDAPCSGTGTWSRDPEAKWRLTPESLAETVALQARILREASSFVAPGGQLAYATCSLLRAENLDQAERFANENNDFSLITHRMISPLQGGDGFGVSILRRNVSANSTTLD
jgi:16S rRNA (cytosine967-C5)-methyltransferase